jgi:molecular chaperone DnaK
MRTKIDFGIDLGTTNSVIAKMENGTPVIRKTDTLKDTLPSCIHFNKKQDILVGDVAYGMLKSEKRRAMKNFQVLESNSFLEFKRTMGSDATYFSSNMNRSYSSEELSAELLKKLKSFAGENMQAIVITVPAKFTSNQKDATVRAARLAGFQHVELIHEPIAASIAYGLNENRKEGYWLVYDFGGGTFDAALLKVEEGIMIVKDTEGDGFLGGKNLDEAIVDEIMIPWLQNHYALDGILNNPDKREIVRGALKSYAEEAKIQLSFKQTTNILTDLGDIPGKDSNGNEIELDITLSQSDLKQLFAPFFQKSINICKDLLTRNHLTGTQLSSLILVGGPTHSPHLRKMLKEQINDKVVVDCDPMTAVAKGAAMFASTLSIPESIVNETRDKTKIQLAISYEPATVETTEWVVLKLLRDKTEGTVSGKLFAEIFREDKAWSSEKKEVLENGEMFEVCLLNNRSNSFEVQLFNETGNKVECQPDRFTIFQGIKPGEAVLPYHIGIEVYDEMLKANVFIPAKGLEKNQKIPTTGMLLNLKTPKQIRPGEESDYFMVPIYQGEYNAEGTRAIYNDHVYDVKLSGQNLPAMLPQGSEVEITIKVDRSEQMHFSAFFPHLDFTEEIKVDTRKVKITWETAALQNEINRAKGLLSAAKNETDENEVKKVLTHLAELEHQLEQGQSNTDRKLQVLENLRKELKIIDRITASAEWPQIEQELKNNFSELEDLVRQINSFDDHRGLDMSRMEHYIAELKVKMNQAIRDKDKKLAGELLQQIDALDFKLRDPFIGVQREISYLKYWDENFSITNWIDAQKARELINRGLQMANGNPVKFIMREIVNDIFDLMVDRKEIDNNLLIHDTSLSIWNITRRN